MIRILLLLTSLLLTACAAQIAANYDRQCKALGAKPGTPAYIDCRLRKEQMDRDTINSIAVQPQPPIVQQPTITAPSAPDIHLHPVR